MWKVPNVKHLTISVVSEILIIIFYFFVYVLIIARIKSDKKKNIFKIFVLEQLICNLSIYKVCDYDPFT